MSYSSKGIVFYSTTTDSPSHSQLQPHSHPHEAHESDHSHQHHDSFTSNPYVLKLKKHEFWYGDFDDIYHEDHEATPIVKFDEKEPYKYHDRKEEHPLLLHGKRVFTRAEVARHNSPTDCWIIIQGKVYNITEWQRHHPGGKEVLIKHAGGDASTDFEAVGHSHLAYDVMQKIHIGYVLEKPRFACWEPAQPPFDYFDISLWPTRKDSDNEPENNSNMQKPNV
jgi:cytochrome b involved in lipid metabolism